MLVALAMVALTPIRIALAVGSLALGSSLLSSLALPWNLFLKLRKISRMLAAVVALGALSGILPPRVFQFASELGTVYLLSQLLTKQLLSPYSSRQTRAEWSALCKRHHYELAAFGAPLVGLFWYLHPLVSLGMLECTQLGAAALVHALEERANLLSDRGDPYEFDNVLCSFHLKIVSGVVPLIKQRLAPILAFLGVHRP
jgi:hypothetical protein